MESKVFFPYCSHFHICEWHAHCGTAMYTFLPSLLKSFQQEGLPRINPIIMKANIILDKSAHAHHAMSRDADILAAEPLRDNSH